MKHTTFGIFAILLLAGLIWGGEPQITATFWAGMTIQEAISTAGSHLLINSEHDVLLNGPEQAWKNYIDAYPAWTGTHIKYTLGAEEAEVWNEGETNHTIIKNFHLNDGWYKVNNTYGIPNGAPSSESDPDARYLVRWQDRDYDGLVARRGDWGGVNRRYVDCYGGPSIRLGGLVTFNGTSLRPSVAPAAPPTPNTPSQPSSGLRALLPTAGLVVVIVALGAGAFVLLRPKGKKGM